MNYKNLFFRDGYLQIENFLNSKEFISLSHDLHKELNYKIETTDLKKIGGYLIGNINVDMGVFAQKILENLNQNNIDKIIFELFDKSLNDFNIFPAGNLNFPGKGNQMFHTDGDFNNTMYLISVATQDISLNSGPTEIVLNHHKSAIPYWKFIFSKKVKKKLIMKKGDILIRKHCTWHRGTKNSSNQPRFLLTFLLFEKKQNNFENYKLNKEITFYNNFFKSDFKGKVKEFFYVNFPFIFFIYKFLRSLLN